MRARYTKKNCGNCGNDFLTSNQKMHCSPKCLLLLRRTIDENGCWLWNGTKIGLGYGQTSYKNKSIRVHRLSYKLFIGEIPEGKYVCHKCDIPNCFNPDHLFISDHKGNMQDCLKKGRYADVKGSKHPLSKLNEEKVIEIRKMLSKGKKGTDISKLFSISSGVISEIKSRKLWSHV